MFRNWESHYDYKDLKDQLELDVPILRGVQLAVIQFNLERESYGADNMTVGSVDGVRAYPESIA